MFTTTDSKCLEFTSPLPENLDLLHLTIEIEKEKEVNIEAHAEWLLYVWGDRCYYNHGQHIYKLPGIYSVYIFAAKLKSLVLDHVFCTSLTLTDCPQLTALDCSYNKLTSLHISAAPLLHFLRCGNNPLRNLDLRHCPELVSVECERCVLENIRISPCSSLRYINCNYNRLTTGLNGVLDTLPACPSFSQGKILCRENPGFTALSQKKLRLKGWEF